MSDALLPIGVGLGILVAGFTVLWVLHRVLAGRPGARRLAPPSPGTPASRPTSGWCCWPCHATLNGLPDADWHRGARHVLYLADIGVRLGRGRRPHDHHGPGPVALRTDVRTTATPAAIHTQVSVIRRIGIAGFAVVAMAPCCSRSPRSAPPAPACWHRPVSPV